MNLKILILISLSFIENGIAQRSNSGGMGRTDTSFQEGSGIPLTIVNSSPEKISTLGSEYIDKTFKDAKVNDGNSLFNLRYNNYSGLFEYSKSATEIVSLSKEKNTKIEFKDGKTYLLRTYSENKKQKEEYLLIVGNTNSKVTLYKLETISYVPYKKAYNSYEKEKQPEYKINKPKYFIEYNDNLISIEKNKDLEKIFPQYNKEIKQFFKLNTIDFASDDVLLVQNFLNSIL